MTYIAWNVRKLTEPGSPGNFPWKFAKKPRHKPLSCGKKRGGHFFHAQKQNPEMRKSGKIQGLFNTAHMSLQKGPFQ